MGRCPTRTWIDETAALVTAEGGRGIAVRTDHTVEPEVERLFGRIRAEQGRLDVLVNDVWGGDELSEWGLPFWELSTAKGTRSCTGTHRPTRWTYSWSGPGSNRPNSTRPPPRKPPTSALGSCPWMEV